MSIRLLGGSLSRSQPSLGALAGTADLAALCCLSVPLSAEQPSAFLTHHHRFRGRAWHDWHALWHSESTTVRDHASFSSGETPESGSPAASSVSLQIAADLAESQPSQMIFNVSSYRLFGLLPGLLSATALPVGPQIFMRVRAKVILKHNFLMFNRSTLIACLCLELVGWRNCRENDKIWQHYRKLSLSCKRERRQATLKENIRHHRKPTSLLRPEMTGATSTVSVMTQFVWVSEMQNERNRTNGLRINLNDLRSRPWHQKTRLFFKPFELKAWAEPSIQT